MAEALDAPVILSDFSRLVIDPNRGEDDPTLLMKVYDGSIIPANRHADASEVERSLARYHRPYHRAIEGLIASRHARWSSPSIPSRRNSKGRAPRPWHVGVLYAGDTRLALPLLGAPERGAGPLCRRQPALFGASAGRRAGPARGADGPAPCPDRSAQRPDRAQAAQRAWGQRLAPMLDAALRIAEV
jgi:predicted N-formylglutamate amidohydrolase